MDYIKKHRKEIQNNILKSFGEENDIEKAVAQVGETREWSDGTYKKISEGKWVKVTNNKEKAVTGSGMVKKVKEEIQSNQEKWDEVKRNFENSLESFVIYNGVLI